MLPQFYEIEEGQETVVLAVCNKMTRELKLAKVYIDQTFKSVSAACEFFYANEESLEQNIRHSLELLGVVRGIFRRDLDELSEDEWEDDQGLGTGGAEMHPLLLMSSNKSQFILYFEHLFVTFR